MGGMGSKSMGSGSKRLGFRLVFPNEHVFPQRFMMQSRTVFGPWLNIQTLLHDNHLLNFLLQHQRYVEDPSIDIPFIFDIDGRTLELETPNLNGQLLLDLVKNDVAFNNLDDDDVVRVCLLLALDYVFMGQEIKHVLLKPIVNLVDNLSEWNKLPWGEYMWREFRKRVYNVVTKHMEYHLKMLGNNPRYAANYALYWFVFPLKVTTPNPATRGSSSSRSVHTCVRKEVGSEVHVRTEVHSFVEEEVCTKSVDKEDVPDIVILEKNVKEQQMQIADMQRRLLLLEVITKRLNNGPSKVDHNVDNNVDHNAWKRIFRKGRKRKQKTNKTEHGMEKTKPKSAKILDMQRGLLSLEHITKTQNNGLSEPDHNADHLDKNGNGSVSVQVGGLDHQSTKAASRCMYSEHLDKNHPVGDLDHQSVEGVSQVTSVNKDLAEESESATIDGLISLQSHDIHS
ncbi:hypothetical protein Tco_1383206 [Tanacetum coccineum]